LNIHTLIPGNSLNLASEQDEVAGNFRYSKSAIENFSSTNKITE
jgi:hypothetical protein